MSTADKIFAKTPSSNYSETKTVGVHAKTGQQIVNPFTQRPAELPSQMENAKTGALLKHLAFKSGIQGAQLSEHERALLDEVCQDEWAGSVGGEYFSSIKAPSRVKALLDDSTSGGLEITPVHFDDSVVTFPLLHSELFPLVDVVDVPRGRRIEGASVDNPTVSWGQGDNTEVALFNTADLVRAIDSTVFGVACAVGIGRDFMSDSAVNVGAILTQNIGQRLASELDNVIANGNGSDRPEGVFVASGLNTVSTDNSTSGPPTVNDYMSLLFSIGKQYRNKSNRCVFVSNDTTYQRSRSIAIDTATPTTDQRPALSPLVEINDYKTLGWGHVIQNDIPNGRCAFGAMSKFRLYRRQGMEVRFVDGGKDLARQNLVLLIVRARYAGKVMDANAFAKWTDGQS